MSKKVNEKSSHLEKDVRTFFLREGFEATVYQIPWLVVMPASSTRPYQTLQGYAG